MPILIILLVCAIPIYFSIKFLLKKLKIENPSNRVFFSFLTALVLMPLTYIAIFYLSFFSITYSPENEFDREEWMAHPNERHEMTKDIIETKMLIGLTKDEISSQLGKEDFRYNDDHWAFDIGFIPGLFNLDPSVLNVKFTNDRVIKVYQHET